MDKDSDRSGTLSRRAAVIGAGASGLAAALLAGGLAPAAAQDATPLGGTPEAAGVGYLVIRQYRLAGTTSIDEVLGKVESGYVPIVRQVAGFQHYFFVDTGNGTLATVGVFADRAGAEESTQRAAEWVGQNLADAFQSPPTVTSGSILLHDVGEGASGTPAP